MIAIDLLLKTSPFFVAAGLATVICQPSQLSRNLTPSKGLCPTEKHADQTSLADMAASLMVLCVSLLTFAGGAYFFSAENVRTGDEKWLERLAVNAAKPECQHASKKPRRREIAGHKKSQSEETSAPAVPSEHVLPESPDNAASLALPSLSGADKQISR